MAVLAHAEEAEQSFGVGAIRPDDHGIDVDAAQHTVALAARGFGALFEVAPHAAVAGVEQEVFSGLEFPETLFAGVGVRSRRER